MKISRAIIGTILGCAGIAHARQYNYEDILMGERSFGMGGASMAFVGDESAIYTNPGVLGLSESPQFTASVSAYNRIDTRTGEYVSVFRSASDNVKRGGFVAVPSMVGGHFIFKGWNWGGAVLLPQSFKVRGKVDFDTSSLASYDSRQESVWIGLFGAKKLSDRHSLGIAVFYASEDRIEKFNFLNGVVAGSVPTNIRFAESSFSANGIVALIGGTYAITDRLRFGYSARSPGLAVAGEGYVYDVSSNAPTGTNAEFQRRTLPIPYRLSAGLAYQARPNLLWALDLHFYGRMNRDISPDHAPELQIKTKEIVNFELGAEWKAWKAFGLRGGFYTNWSAARGVPRGLTAINDHVNMFGGTGALFWEKDKGTLSLGGYVQGGQGSSVSLKNPTAETFEPRSNYIYGFVVGSSYAF